MTALIGPGDGPAGLHARHKSAWPGQSRTCLGTWWL